MRLAARKSKLSGESDLGLFSGQSIAVQSLQIPPQERRRLRHDEAPPGFDLLDTQLGEHERVGGILKLNN